MKLASMVAAAVLAIVPATTLASIPDATGGDPPRVAAAARTEPSRDAAPLMGGAAAPQSSASRTAAADFWMADGYDWPTASHTVLRGFDHLEANWLPGHRGVDIAGTPGEEIRSAGRGRVIYARRVADTNVVSVEHSHTLRTTYTPVKATVKAGDYVEMGEVIGTLDDGHCVIGACLHWGAIRRETRDVYLDPLSLLSDATIRLFPVSD